MRRKGAGRVSAALRHDVSRYEVLAGRFLWVAAFALAVAAVVPADVVGYQVASWREIVHGGAGWIALLGFPVAACALRRRLSPWLTALAAACGVLCVAIVVIWLGLTRSWQSFPLGSHHTTFGLVERAAMTTAFAWLSLAAATLRTRPT